MKKINLIILFLLATLCILNAQVNMPTVVPPSPQAAQFNRYGEIPVGYTTGVPQIDIPIYTLSTGWIDIPISISYHASGFRVRDIPSPVGLGWVLNAGGLISRSIEVKPDFEDSNVMSVKSNTDVTALKNGTLKPLNIDFSKYNNVWYWENYIFSTQSTSSLDTRSDRYCYDFLGNIGIARYDVDANKLLPVPYAPLNISRVSKDNYVITDTKGIKYEFTYPDYTISTANNHNGATGWYLTKITYPGMENDPIVFSYRQATQYSEVIYSQITSYPYRLYCYNDFSLVRCSSCCPQLGVANTKIQATTIYYKSPIITSIQWRNVTIEFNYVSDRKDQRKERLTSVVVKHGSNIIRQAVFDNNYYFGNTERNYRLKLNSISLYGSSTTGSPETYSFNYNSNTTVLPDYYQYYANNASSKPCNEDLWGYYNGANSNYVLPTEIRQYLYKNFNQQVSSNESANRRPSETSTKTCILEEIVYPTKGKTRFEYEINRSPKYYASVGDAVNDAVGGLRLKKRINYSETGAVTDIKEYQYEGYSTINLSYAMFVGEQRITEQFCAGEWATVVYTVGLSSPMLSLSGWGNNPVFYNKVTEYNGEIANQNYSGKTEYYYTDNSFANFPSICYYDGTGYMPMNFSIYNDCDKGFINGLLYSTKVFNKNGGTIKTIGNQYKFYNIPYIHTGVHLEQIRKFPSGFQWYIDFEKSTYGNNWDPQLYYQTNFLNDIIAVNTYAMQEVSLPEKTTETDYVNGQPANSKVTSYGYNIKDSKPILFTPSSVTVQNSNGENWVKSTAYPYSDAYKNTAPYNTMVTKNMLDYPVEVKTSSNQFVNQTVTSYKQVSNMILPAVVSVKYTASGALEPRIVYSNYDSHGNPLYLTKDNSDRIVYLWGYNYQYPIAEIQNASYSEVTSKITEATLNSIAAKKELNTSDSITINNLRTQLSDAHVTTYTYKPLVGMQSMTDPRGVITKYEYDPFGRLNKVTQAGKVIETYDYHYKN